MSTFDWLDDESEELRFYGGEAIIYYDDKEHSYYQFVDDLIHYIPGVTSACGIVDKSAALMQWAANLAVDYIGEWYRENTDADWDTFQAALEKGRFAHRDYKENAADIGHIAHGWHEKNIKAQIAGRQFMLDLPTHEQAANGCIAALNWMNRHKVRWVYTERKVWSRRHDFAGTMDGLAYISSCGDAECCGHWVKRDGRWVREALHFENILAVIDWKTSNQLHTSYHWQTSAYKIAIEEEAEVDPQILPGPIIYRVVARLGKDDAQFEARLLTPETLARDFETFLTCRALYLLVNVAEDEEKALKKAVREQAKEDRLVLACSKSKTYKGFRFPKCNGGDPCKACLDKYYERHPQERPDAQPQAA
jgi:hypothetical protein